MFCLEWIGLNCVTCFAKYLYAPVLNFPRNLISREEAPTATPNSPFTSCHPLVATFLSFNAILLTGSLQWRPRHNNSSSMNVDDTLRTHHTLRSRTLSGNVTVADTPAASSTFSNPMASESLCQISKIPCTHEQTNREELAVYTVGTHRAVAVAAHRPTLETPATRSSR